MSRYIIDGYNVIGAHGPYRDLAATDRGMARARLVEDVAGFSAPDRHMTVVFDAAGNPHSDGAPHHVAGVVVLFSRAGESADEVIETLARRSRERGEPTVVVTSDAQTQWTVMGGHVSRMSSAQFVAEVLSDASDRREHAPARGRVRLEDRIEPGVRAVLDRWARGL